MPVQCRSPCSFAHVDCRNVHISCCISYQCVYDCIVSAGLTTDATACAAVCRVALETQEVAIGIMGDLADQRETIQRSRGRVSLCAGSTALLSRLFHPVPSGVCARGFALLLLPVPFRPIRAGPFACPSILNRASPCRYAPTAEGHGRGVEPQPTHLVQHHQSRPTEQGRCCLNHAHVSRAHRHHHLPNHPWVGCWPAARDLPASPSAPVPDSLIAASGNQASQPCSCEAAVPHTLAGRGSKTERSFVGRQQLPAHAQYPDRPPCSIGVLAARGPLHLGCQH